MATGGMSKSKNASEFVKSTASFFRKADVVKNLSRIDVGLDLTIGAVEVGYRKYNGKPYEDILMNTAISLGINFTISRGMKNLEKVANKWTGNVKGYDVEPIKSSYKDRLDQTPINNGTWTGERGESVFISDNPLAKPHLENAGIDGIEYKGAMVDFSPVSKGQVTIEGMSSNRNKNYNLADIEMAKEWSTPDKVWTAKDVKMWRIENNFTWHELNNGTMMDLVPTDINSIYGHLGGVSEVKP